MQERQQERGGFPRLKVVKGGGAPATQLYDEQMERALLGSVLLDAQAYWEATEHVEASTFYSLRHQQIWAAMASVMERGDEVDIVLLAREVMDQPDDLMGRIGGLGYLASLTVAVPTAANAVWYAKKLSEMRQRRQLRELAQRFDHDLSYQTEPLEDMLARFRADVDQVTARSRLDTVQPVQTHAFELMGDLERYQRGEVPRKTFISTGIPELDRLMGGQGPELGEVLLLMAPSGYGKTASALNLMRFQAAAGVPCLFCTGEMAPKTNMLRMVSAESRVPFGVLRNCTFSSAQQIEAYVQAVQRLGALPIYTDEDRDLTATKLVARMRRYKDQYGVQVVYYDHIQNISLDDTDRHLSESSRKLKALETLRKGAQDLGIQLWVLSQTNGAHLSRKEDPRPQATDTAFSKHLRQELDWMIYFWRQGKFDPRGPDTVGEFGLVKARHGQEGVVFVNWHGPTLRIWPQGGGGR